MLVRLQAPSHLLPVLSCLQELSKRIREVLQDSRMQAKAAAVAVEVAGCAGVSQAADIALGTTSPWSKLRGVVL